MRAAGADPEVPAPAGSEARQRLDRVDDGRPERLVACEVCGLIQGWPAPPSCPACGSAHG